MTLVQAAQSEIQFRFNTEYVPKFANELTFLFPMFDTWTGYGQDEQWMVVRCLHPRRPSMTLGSRLPDIVVRYRLGARHQWLLAKNGREWALRRVELLMRLLLQRLAREVEKEK